MARHDNDGDESLQFLATPLARRRQTLSHVSFTDSTELLHGQPTAYKPGEVVREQGEAGETGLFRHHHESTPMELFYDLFAVANLSVFTEINDLNSGRALANYLGYVALLWIMWFQVTLFDVRFSWDSLVDRFFKAVQFAVMLGFTWAATSFDPGDDNPETTNVARTQDVVLSLSMFVGRAALALQYTQVALQTRGVREASNARSGLLLTATISASAALLYLVTAIVYLTTSVADRAANDVYALWYVVGVLELVLVMVVPLRFKDLGFWNTHLIERLGLLPLIVLGEGVLQALSSTRGAWDKRWFTSEYVPEVLAAVLLLYFAAMLYFDIRPQRARAERTRASGWLTLWAILHFPYNLALIITCLGNSLMARWRLQSVAVSSIFATFAGWGSFAGSQQEFADAVNAYASSVASHYARTSTDASIILGQIADNTETLATAAAGGADYLAAWYRVQLVVLDTLFNSYGLVPIPVDWSADPHMQYQAVCDKLADVMNLLNLVFVYFTVAAGLVLVFLGLMGAASSRLQDRALRAWRLAPFFAVGAALCLLATMRAEVRVDFGSGDTPSRDSSAFIEAAGQSASTRLIQSGWVAPLSMLCFLCVLVALHARWPRWLRSRWAYSTFET